MNRLVMVLLALIGGFIAGIIITKLFAIAGHFLFDQTSWMRGFKYFPFITALVSAIAVWIWAPSRSNK